MLNPWNFLKAGFYEGIKFALLRGANPGVNINPRDSQWRNEILQMLDGTWEDAATGVNTRSDRSHFQA